MIPRAPLIAALVGSLLLSSLQAQTDAPSKIYSSALTESFPLFFDKDPERIRSRLDSYQNLGVEALRLHAFKQGPDQSVPYFDLIENYDFSLRMILYALPNQQFTDNKGAQAGKTINFWHPEGRKILMQNNRILLKQLRKRPLWEKVDALIPTMGPAGELTYLPTWTTGQPHMTFWCYGPHAQKNFRAAMQKKYDNLPSTNRLWGTSFTSWEEVRIPKPGAHPGALWEDILTWYRDSKRDFARWHVREFKKLTDKRVILYIPGEHFTEADWQQAVKTAGKKAPASIMMMLDSDFIIKLAVETDCDLQYTGLSRAESQYIARKAKEYGYHGPIYGENAGSYGPASSPLGLGSIVVESGFSGIDYTSSKFLFQSDLITPTPLHQELGDAFKLIKGITPPKRWTTPPPYLKAPLKSLWTILAEPGEKHGLHAMVAGDKAPPVISRKNKPAWQIGPGKGESTKLYLALQDPSYGFGKTPRVILTLEYFDEGKGTIQLDYDSSDSSVKKIPAKPGSFKAHPLRIELKNTRQWKTARFPINDALFANRCNARDARLNITEGDTLIIRSLGLELPDR